MPSVGRIEQYAGYHAEFMKVRERMTALGTVVHFKALPPFDDLSRLPPSKKASVVHNCRRDNLLAIEQVSKADGRAPRRCLQ